MEAKVVETKINEKKLEKENVRHISVNVYIVINLKLEPIKNKEKLTTLTR